MTGNRTDTPQQPGLRGAVQAVRGVPGLLGAVVVGLGLALATACVSCNDRVPPPGDTPPTAATQVPAPPEPPQPPPIEEPPPIRPQGHPDDSERWLTVEKLRDGAKGGYATGRFLPARNRIEIQTDGVQQFALRVDRIGIDWERLVVFRLDGSTSELRRRDYQTYHFARDEAGRWAVQEPGDRP